VYRAKDAGRGCVELFSGTARAALKERNDVERALSNAIVRDELVVHYQPIINMQTGLVDCYEALVRWNRPGVGLLPPAEFLPVAESSNLICDLDAWVLRAAVAQLATWNQQRGDRELQVAVNISGRHISQRRIQRDVAAVLTAGTIDPGQLVIEVTETVLMDGNNAAANLEALRAIGVVASLDDFGTGYQSSTQLSRLPIDVVKIDRDFVDPSSDSERSLLELMVKSAHAFGFRVVAEGVESEAQLELIRSLGCEYVQGFYFGKPLPADQVLALARGRRLLAALVPAVPLPPTA
jgi:EAL domain-containing protein (putative c-di-GMP-specific phosphodiesterase class I)